MSHAEEAEGAEELRRFSAFPLLPPRENPQFGGTKTVFVDAI
jgi:hypothetical protein